MPATRLAVIDLARGLAVVAMAIYHFSWDLSWFGLVDWPVAQGANWRIFAGSIAGSFLFLAGVSLDLAHHNGIRWRAFWRRLAVIVAAAVSVSLVTYFTFGDSYVRFGILHCIALSSLIALPFARLPLWSVIAASALVLSSPLWATSSVFDGQVWLWTGLGLPDFGSVDYVPLAPWAGVTLAGLAFSSTARRLGLWELMAHLRFSGWPGIATRFCGRHSLIIYLLHQPALYGLVWASVTLAPEFAFMRSCSVSCHTNLGTAATCESTCACTLNHLKSDNIWTALRQDPTDPVLRGQMSDRYRQCLADPSQVPEVD
ncbi:heparan-alpha-glucosaminide N-acetyltransferase [Roseibium sediminicola]|uniref:DUF1624 domain-containing protein n=1 Tax=Roseibium sediminicola TaxID=2933272 RepID=A0ABT0GTM8_9HYPH|nr:heparan-alpha-glucosaminide N-acetyltransferase [Roseibium sp. CAU 1639]MCK7612641.1 DUF1624 domain-containing protein [Roseibium sp. CAU 1639]